MLEQFKDWTGQRQENWMIVYFDESEKERLTFSITKDASKDPRARQVLSKGKPMTCTRATLHCHTITNMKCKHCKAVESVTWKAKKLDKPIRNA